MDEYLEDKIEIAKSYSTFDSYCIGRACSNGCPYFYDNKNCEKQFNDLKNGKYYDYYIAAPFFNEEQVERVKLVENMLMERGLTFFSPRTDSAVEDISKKENREKVFKLNHDSILASKGLIAITDGKDVGTMIEVGMAYQANIPIIGVAFTLRDDQLFNLMIAESCFAVARNAGQLEKIISTGESIKYTGAIE